MATDQKLLSQIMDLSRNVEKLSGEMKKNTTVTSELTEKKESENKEGAKDQTKILESLKGLDFKGLKDELSSVAKGFTGFDIKGLTDGIKGLDFKGLSKDLKGLDFKGLGDGLKNLDIKGLTTDLKKLDFKDLTQSIKGIDLKGLSNLKGGLGDIKNLDISSLTKGGGIKDIVSGSIGSIGKGILGGFESGGKVKIPGNYIVGEGGPEIAQLPKDTNIIPNNKTEAILSGNPSSINTKLKEKKGSKYPSNEEIAAKRSELLKEDPVFYSDPAELNDELEYFIQNYKSSKQETFTREDVQKLGKPAAKNEAPSAAAPTAVTTSKVQEATKSETVKNKQGLFSRISGKKEAKSGEAQKEGGFNASSIISKGSQLLSSVPPQLMGKFGSDAGSASGVLDAIGKTEMPKLTGPANAPEIKNLIPSLSKKMAQPKAAEQDNSNTGASNIMEGISDITSKSGIGNAISGLGDSAKSAISEVAKGIGGIGGTSEPSGGGQVDMSEVVDVLTKILNAMNGPLKVSPMDSPFRPNSKRI